MSADFWRREGLRHLTPAGKDNPEGWDVWGFLRELAEGDVVEIGCGAGRLCRAFDPEEYLGTDVNKHAIEVARKRHPQYRFAPYERQSADTAILYTVLLHVSDDELGGLISGIRARRVVVAEIMGRRWRRPGNPPAFNREAEEYRQAFSRAGFVQSSREDRPYLHYQGTDITFLVFQR